MKLLLILMFSLGIVFPPLSAQAPGRETILDDRVVSERASFRLIRAAGGLQNPWGMAFLPDGSILITERGGRLRIFRDGRLESVIGLPEIRGGGQGGLLDIALHPDFSRTRWIYFTYSAEASERGQSGTGTALYRARLEGNSLDRMRLVGGEELYRMPGFSGTGVHFGSRIVFAPDGTLFMTIGDRGDRHRAQRLDDAAGKTLRFNDDGTIPRDNPFADRENSRGALPEIFSYGHRNAQGMAVYPETGVIWQHEHGPRGGDEVNILKPGANYGWPVVTFGEEYQGGSIGQGTSAAGMEEPLIHWTPSIAPSGMTFYTGTNFPEWRGNIFVGALAGRHLRRLELEGERIIRQEILLLDRIGRIRDVREGPDGNLWILTDERDGGLYRLEPSM